MVEYKGTTYEVSEEVAAALDDLETAYAEAYEEAAKSIQGQVGLFEELEIKSDMTVEKMEENWQKQTEVMNNYADDLQKAMELAKDGVLDSGLLATLNEMGIDAAGYLHELVTAAETNSDEFGEVMEAWGERAAAMETITKFSADIMTSYTETKEAILATTGETLDGMETEIDQGLEDIAATASTGGEKVGSNLGEGVNTGLASTMKKVVGTAGGYIGSVISAMRQKAKINSPSKETEYIGNMMGEGVVVGEVESLEKGRVRIQAALAEVLHCGYEEAMNHFPVLTDPIQELGEEYRELGEPIQDLSYIYQDLGEPIQDLSYIFTDHSAALADAGDAMLEYMVRGVELDGSVESTAKRVEQLRDTYAKAREEAEQSIDSQVRLFDRLEMKSDITIKDMIESLRSQTNYFIEYGADLSKAVDLAQQGLLDKGLLGAIQELGLSGAGYLHELVTVAQTDMTSFSTVMSEWALMSQTKENLSATMAGVGMLYGDKMEEVVAIQKSKGEEIEAQAAQMAENVKEAVSSSGAEIVSRTSESLDGTTEVISGKSPEVKDAVTDLCSTAIEGFQKSLDIDTRGKSKKFATVGYSIPEGIAEGIHDGQDLVVNAVRDVIENSIRAIDFDGLSGTIVRKINKELGGMID